MKNVSCEYDRWVVEKLCKLRDASLLYDTCLLAATPCLLLYWYLAVLVQQSLIVYLSAIVG